MFILFYFNNCGGFWTAYYHNSSIYIIVNRIFIREDFAVKQSLPFYLLPKTVFFYEEYLSLFKKEITTN